MCVRARARVLRTNIHSVQIRSNLNQYNFRNKFFVSFRSFVFFSSSSLVSFSQRHRKVHLFMKFKSCWKGIHRKTWIFLFDWQKWMCMQKLGCMKNNRNSYRWVFAIIFQKTIESRVGDRNGRFMCMCVWDAYANQRNGANKLSHAHNLRYMIRVFCQTTSVFRNNGVWEKVCIVATKTFPSEYALKNFMHRMNEKERTSY